MARRRVWTTQPPPGTGIDWDNPLTDGLIFAFPGNGTVELVSGASSTTAGSVTPAVSADGVGNSNFSSANYLNWPQAIPPAFETNTSRPYSFFGIAATDLSAAANISQAGTVPNATWIGATIIGAGSAHNPSNQLAITYGSQYDYAFPGTFFETAGTPYRILIAQTGNAANAWRNHRFFGSMSGVGTCTGLYYGIGIGNGFVTAGFIGPVFWWAKDVTATGDVIAANPWQLFHKRRRAYSLITGSTISASISESVTSADSYALSATAAAAISEAATSADAYATSATIFATLTETIAPSDAYAIAVAVAAALDSSAAASSALTAVATIAATIAEVSTAQDTLGVTATVLAAIAEAATATDTQATGSVTSAAYADSATAAAIFNATVSIAATLTEAGLAADQIAAMATVAADLAESGAASDAYLRSVLLAVELLENAAAADELSAAAFKQIIDAAKTIITILQARDTVNIVQARDTVNIVQALDTLRILQ